MALDIQITDKDLPVLSVVATQALELLQDKNVTHRRIEELIRQDLALTERLLRTANSPFYATRNSSTSISQAILRLGLRQLRTTIVIAATGELFNSDDAVIRELWDHALATAIAANQLADLLQMEQAEEAFIGGMLHDVGKLIIYHQHPDTYRQLMEEAKTCGRDLQELEVERFEYFSHMLVGGLVVRKWRLSDSIAEAARFHHALETEIPRHLKTPKLACLISVANRLVHQLEMPWAEHDWEKMLAMPCSGEIGVTRVQLEAVRQEILGMAENHRLTIH
jgi:putative nucleotidyltransferase with HDIG domain